MNLAAVMLPQRVVEALGWTLFHSLWQGTLAALGFALVLYFSRRTGARLRYGLGLAALVLLVLVSALTFWNHYDAGVPTAPAPLARQAAVVPAPMVTPTGGAASGEPSRMQRIVAFFSDYFGRNLPLLVTLWLLGVLFFALRFTGGMLYLQRLKYRQSRSLPSPWPERLQVLAARAGLRRPLRLLESLRLRTPVVIGHLKPVLLLPVGLVTGLPSDQVEVLLAHELAHVVRRDYLVNVLQNLVEVLYFFHPGVRWISAAVRQEREHCCDDFAVELCGDPQNYARALARLQMGDIGYPEPALAAVGRPRRLLRRIARLLARSRLGATVRPRLAHDFREGFASALLLVLGLLGMLKLAAAAAPAVAAAAIEPKPAATEKSPADRFVLASFVLDTAGTARLIIAVPTRWGKLPSTWLVDARDGRVVWYKTLAPGAKQGKQIPFNEEVALEAGTYGWYFPKGSFIGLLRKSTNSKEPWTFMRVLPVGKNSNLHSLSEAELLLKNSQEARLITLKDMLSQVEELKVLDEREASEQLYLMREDIQRLKAEQLRQQAEEQRLLTVEERELKEKEFQKLEQELMVKADAMRKMKEKERQELLLQEKSLQAEAELARQTAIVKELDLKVAEELKAQEKRLREEEARLRAQETMIRQLIRELIDSGLVKEGEGYKVKLSASSLVINGKAQPAAAHEKIKKFYESTFGKKLDGKVPITIVQEKE